MGLFDSAATGATIGSAVPGVGTLIGGAVGGLAGLLTSSNSQSNSVGSASPSADKAQGYVDKSLSQQYDFAQAGPGQTDVTNAYQSSLSLAQLFQQYAQTGGLPNQQQTQYAGGVAKNLFAGQQADLNNSFVTQRQQAQQRAAALGRSPDDPVLAAKLATAQTQQQGVLSGQEQGAAQSLALSLPGQQLGYAMQGNQLLQGLASQAFSNRAAILAQGNQIVGADNNLRVKAGTQINTVGGGFGNALAGAVGGAAAGTNTGSFFNQLGSTMSGSTPNPGASNWAGMGQNGWSVTDAAHFA